jgi:hypothetical protein
MSKLKVHVWGKHGCAKCKALLDRLNRMDTEGELDIEYHDILTVQGLAEFCRHGDINGNNIPAFTVEGDFTPLGAEGWPFPGSKPLYDEYGVCTDYETGGVMRPEMIKTVIENALEK